MLATAGTGNGCYNCFATCIHIWSKVIYVVFVQQGRKLECLPWPAAKPPPAAHLLLFSLQWDGGEEIKSKSKEKVRVQVRTV